ncbi:unnamed protein product [Cuscuta epithymum]|uniref:SET domain-containing protein n=1 Tax=Cuscuta epithymum TaxID=186058 RepID=A0AAV0G8B9_9ASTE|nr:unnamed protein product [Cuscuta epithymum]
MAADSSSMLRKEKIPGKGSGLVAAKPLKAGETILTESPLVLYSASPLFSSPSASPFTYCDHCFGLILPPSDSKLDHVSCPSCSNHHFCSHKCLSLAFTSSHSPWVCKALTSLMNSSSLFQQHPPERQVQARFLVAVHNLLRLSPSHIQTLLSLHGTPDDSILRAAEFLHSLISTHSELEISVDTTALLLAKDRLNSFCLMGHYSPDGPQRSIKAYAIYPTATFFNHDCIPNACRFDYVYVKDHKTDISFRMIRDVEEGEEVCISYFRINRDYCTRKRILMEDYGFTCECSRCKIEANWDDGENQWEKNSDLPHVRFLRKYVCEAKNCAGTMAPLSPQDAIGGGPSRILECNFCGDLKMVTDR